MQLGKNNQDGGPGVQFVQYQWYGYEWYGRSPPRLLQSEFRWSTEFKEETISFSFESGSSSSTRRGAECTEWTVTMAGNPRPNYAYTHGAEESVP